MCVNNSFLSVMDTMFGVNVLKSFLSLQYLAQLTCRLICAYMKDHMWVLIAWGFSKDGFRRTIMVDNRVTDGQINSGKSKHVDNIKQYTELFSMCDCDRN